MIGTSKEQTLYREQTVGASLQGLPLKIIQELLSENHQMYDLILDGEYE